MRKICLLLCVLYACAIHAQRGAEVGVMLGAVHYFGDLNTDLRVNRPGLAVGILGRYNFNERVALKLSANYGRVEAYDSDSDNSFEKARNLHFRSNIIDGAAQIEFNFLPYRHGHEIDFFSPYIFVGFNIFYYNPEAELNGTWYELRNMGTEGQFQGEEYFSVSGGLVYGGGVKVSLNYEWSINVELSSRWLFTDYLDDVSTVYPDQTDLRNLHGDIAIQLSDRSIPNGIPQIGQEGRQRGNDKDNDFYTFLQVGLVYYFGDVRCPKIYY